MNQNTYAIAARIKSVLYQQPCYCHCDQQVGHQSLLDCFVDAHASVCTICKKEAVFAYDQTKKGKSPAKIREGIIKGEWEKIDSARYNIPSTLRIPGGRQSVAMTGGR